MNRDVLTVIAALVAIASGVSAALGGEWARPAGEVTVMSAVPVDDVHDHGGVKQSRHDPVPDNRRKAARRMTAKPTAPVGVRWLSTGQDGTASVQVVSGVDHVGATVRVTVPGQGQPLMARLPAAAAGEVQIAEWTLEQRPATGPLRAVVEIDTGDHRMARAVVTPAYERGKPEKRPVPMPQGERPATKGGPETNPAVKMGQDEALIELPAQQTVRRQGE